MSTFRRSPSRTSTSRSASLLGVATRAGAPSERSLTPILTLGLVAFMGLTVAACGGATDGDGGSGAAPDAGRVAGTVTGDLIVVDRDEMPDLPCHAMDNTIMGQCSEDDVAGLLAEMGLNPDEIVVHDKQLMAEEACHVMQRTIMGTCSEADVERLAEEIRSTN